MLNNFLIIKSILYNCKNVIEINTALWTSYLSIFVPSHLNVEVQRFFPPKVVKKKKDYLICLTLKSSFDQETTKMGLKEVLDVGRKGEERSIFTEIRKT
jgi:hypothetical protein